MTIGGMSITTKAVTGDGFGTPAHFDKEDFGGYSWLIFYRLGSDEAEVIGGAFYFPEFGMRFQPGRCSAMLLNTQGVEHGTTPSRSDGDARVVATAVYANNQCVIYRRKYLRGEYKDLVDRRYVLEQSKIPHKLRKIQAVQAVLDLNPHG